MAVSKSLIGKWKLLRDGSDFLPGLDTLSDSPLVTKLLGNQDIEFFKIEKRKYMDIEEILFTYTSKNASIARSYQLGTINFEYVNGGDVILASVQNCVDSFNEITLSRLGSKTGQNSRELYQLDPLKDIIKLSIDITTSEGTVLKLIKFLTRFDSSTTENFMFELSPRTNGWRLHDYWPSTIISSTSVCIVQAIKVKFLNSFTNEKTRLTDILWGNGHEIEKDIEWNTLSRCFSGKSHENDDFVAFVIRVNLEDLSWYTIRRYNEFDALRHFLIAQNPHNTEFQQANNRFPGKALVFRKSVLDARLRGLEEFLSFYLTNSRYCRQTALDALCYFLQIPEHCYFKSKGSIPSNSRGISTSLPSQATNPLSSVAPNREPTASTVNPVSSITSGSNAKIVSVLKDESTASSNSQSRLIKGDLGKQSASESLTSSAPAVSSSVPAIATLPTTAKPTQGSHPQFNTKVEPTTAAIPVHVSSDQTDSHLTHAQQRLLDVLGDGMHIIKHGRQGAPKHRLLRCNRQATELFIQADAHRKTLKLSDVESIRLGTDIDPITSPDAIRSLNETSSDAGKRPSVMRRASMSIRGIHDSTVYFGTATLRRTCKPDDMRLCLSLIMPDRTFDIQCKSSDDLDLLNSVLTEACGNKLK